MRTFRIPLVLVTACALTAACADQGGGAGTPTPGTSYVVGADSLTDADVKPSPTPTQAQEGDGGEPGNNNGNGNSGNSGPRIESFKIKQQPSCPAGTDLNPIEGRDVVVEWKVTGTDEVTISVDGPGVFGTFGATGEQSFAFGCGDKKPGEKAKHTYLLMTVGGGDVAKKTITATATVNEITQVSPAPEAVPDAP
jgi:hypothetical protein